MKKQKQKQKHPMDINTNTRMRWEIIGRYPEISDLRGKRVLDLGSGLGYFSLRFRELGAYVHSVDVDRGSLTFIREAYGVETSYEDIENAPLPDGQFDLIFIGEVMEHLKNPAELMGRVSRSLSGDGMALITVPALEGPFIHTKGKMLGHEHGSEKHERDGFLYNDLAALIDGAGMEMARHDVTIYWLSELFMQLTKRGYMKKKKVYSSQSDIIDLMKSPKYRLVSALYPLFMPVFRLEQYVCDALGARGHCHVILARKRLKQ